MSVASLLNTTVDITRRTSTSDGRGGQTATWSTVGTIPARVSQPTSTTDVLLGDQDVMHIVGIVYLEPGADVRRNDRIAHDGRVLEVRDVIEPSVGVYLRATCRDIQAGS